MYSSQIQLKPNYNGSSCDTINSQAINQPNSLGVSITSTLGNKCNGGSAPLGVIIGLSVGVPCACLIVALVGLLIKKKRENDLNRKIDRIGNRMENMTKGGVEETKWKENKTSSGGTKWINNKAEFSN